MDFGIVIIGSELLSGKRKDTHMAHCIKALSKRGLELSWCTILGDQPPRITAALRASMAAGGAVFCFGGIGATPDDHTRQCAADAAGVSLAEHDEAAEVIKERFGEGAYPQRIRMAHLPIGCTLIPNPVNRIAGFSLGNHHFVPGFPQMAWPMMEWVLETRYSHWFKAQGVETLLMVPGASEGQLMGIMEDFVERFPDVQLSCLPHMEGEYRETELGVRGARESVDEAAQWLSRALDREGFTWSCPESRGPTP